MKLITTILIFLIGAQTALGKDKDEETSLYKEVALFFESNYKEDIKDLPNYALEEYSKYLQNNSLRELDEETALKRSNNKTLFLELKPLFEFWKIYLSIEVVEQQLPGIEIDYKEQKLLISTKLVDLCGVKGVFSLAAHEMAHILFVNASTQLKASLAKKNGSNVIRELKKIEFCCDVIAYYTIKRLGLDSNVLLNSLFTVDRYLQTINYNGSSNLYDYHPRIPNRLALLRSLSKK